MEAPGLPGCFPRFFFPARSAARRCFLGGFRPGRSSELGGIEEFPLFRDPDRSAAASCSRRSATTASSAAIRSACVSIRCACSRISASRGSSGGTSVTAPDHPRNHAQPPRQHHARRQNVTVHHAPQQQAQGPERLQLTVDGEEFGEFNKPNVDELRRRLDVRPHAATLGGQPYLDTGYQQFLLSVDPYDPTEHGEFRELIERKLRLEIRYESIYGGEGLTAVYPRRGLISSSLAGDGGPWPHDWPACLRASQPQLLIRRLCDAYPLPAHSGADLPRRYSLMRSRQQR